MSRRGIVTLLGALAAWEVGWWARRRDLRSAVYACAARRAAALNRKLVVVGAPDRGATSGYPCGDVTVDIGPSSCPVTVTADISKHIPLDDNSAVVFVACTLEYVNDFDGAMQELNRVAGDPNNVFIVRVEPWTLAAWLYPGRKWIVPASVLPKGC